MSQANTMQRALDSAFRVGSWHVVPAAGELQDGGVIVRVEPGIMDLLCVLAANPGRVMSREALLAAVWEGKFVTDDVVRRAIATLRKHLGDAAAKPIFIETIPRRGYRLIAEVSSETPRRANPVALGRGMASPGTPAVSPPIGNKAALRAAVIALSLVALVTTGHWHRSSKQAEQLEPKTSAEMSLPAVRAPRLILLADWINQTGEPELDHLYKALGISLNQSRHFSLLPPRVIWRALKHLELSPDTPLDRQVAGQVARRESVARLVIGSIGRVDDQYWLTAELIDTQTDRTVWASRLEVIRREHLIGSLQRLANDILEELGATAGEIAELPRLEDVTTSSIEALETFSLACSSSDPAESMALLQHTLELDPGFASARVWLANLLWHQGKPRSEVLSMMADALQRTERLTETERLSAQALMALVRGRLDQALSHTQALAKLYPERLAPRIHLTWSYRSFANEFARGLEIARTLPRCTRCDVPERTILRSKGMMELAAGDSRLAEVYLRAALEDQGPLKRIPVLLLLRDLKGAGAALEQTTGEPGRTRSRSLARLWILWLLEQGRIGEAIRLHDQQSTTGGDTSRRERTPSLMDLRWLMLKLGSEAFSGSGSAIDGTLDQVLAAGASLAARAPDSSLLFAVAMAGKIAARTRHLDRAADANRRLDELMTAGSPNRPRRAYEQLLLGEVARAQGDDDLAIQRLTRSLQEMESFTVHESLASAHESAGNLDEAIEHYRWMVSNRGRAVVECPLGRECYERAYNLVAWALAHVRLARLLESRGEVSESVAWYSELVWLWPHADDALPEVRFARQRLEALRPLG